jgi:hypothetical protein
MKPDQPTADSLRHRAKERLRNQGSKVSDQRSETENQRLLHELQVHQIELERQNE